MMFCYRKKIKFYSVTNAVLKLTNMTKVDYLTGLQFDTNNKKNITFFCVKKREWE